MCLSVCNLFIYWLRPRSSQAPLNSSPIILLMPLPAHKLILQNFNRNPPHQNSNLIFWIEMSCGIYWIKWAFEHPKTWGKGHFFLLFFLHFVFRPNLSPIFSTSKAQLNFCCPSNHLSGVVSKKGCNAFSKPLGKCASTQRQPSLNALGIASITNIKLNLLDFNHVHPNIYKGGST